jgi:hypothetical protein
VRYTIVAVLCLAGCASAPPKVVMVSQPAIVVTHIIYVHEHDKPRTCAPQPPPPVGTDNHEMGNYLAASILAGADCRAKYEAGHP